MLISPGTLRVNIVRKTDWSFRSEMQKFYTTVLKEIFLIYLGTCVVNEMR